MEAWKPHTVAPRRSRVSGWLKLAQMDQLMLGASIALIAISVFTLATAGPEDVPGQAADLGTRQGFYALLGLGLMLAASRLDYRRLREHRAGIYAATIGSIAAVLLIGTAVRGSNRWIELFEFRFQPSELAKVLLCVSLAAFASDWGRRPSFGPRQALTLLALGLAPAALVLLQPDLSTGVVLVVLAFAVLFFAGVSGRSLAVVGVVGAVLAGGTLAAGPAVGIDALHDYQQERVIAFLHPSDDPGDASYQVNQAVIAVGSGGGAGRGEEATQSALQFLPERDTDFVFAVLGERFGYLGAAVVVSLYALLLWRALRVVARARSFYGVLIAGGIVTVLAFQIVVNLGMNVGVMPVAGITLPLMSFGGSSLLTTFLALGLLQSIHVDAEVGRACPPASFQGA